MTQSIGMSASVTLPKESPLRSASRHLSSVVERMLSRYRQEPSPLVDLTLQPMPEAAFRPVINMPTRPGTPVNIRVNDPAEDTIFGNKTIQSEPSIAVSGHTVVVGFNDSTPIGSFAGLANSINLGQVFSDEGALTPADESGDPVLVTDTQGTFYYAMLVANFNTRESYIGVSKSLDGGMTFPVPADASGTSGAQRTSFQDKGWLSVDRSDGPGNGHLYLCWTQFTNFDWLAGYADHSQILFARSTDGGTSWSRPLALTDLRPVFGPQGAVSAVDPEGRVYVAWLARDRSSIELRRSDDRGMVFSNPVADDGAVTFLVPITEPLNGNVRADSFVSLAVDPASGTLYLAFAAIPERGTADVFCTRSSDHGAHWSPPVRVNDDVTDTDQWMPSVAVTSDGVVGVMFCDRRNDPADNLNIDVYLAMSKDCGASFLPSLRITTASFPPPVLTDPQIEIQHMGDYNHMVAQGARFFLAWRDNRDFVGTRNDPNIYFATVGTQDCYVRNNSADDGAVPNTGLVYLSPDIAPAMNPTRPDLPNAVTVTVHNHGPLPARNVAVSLCWSEPATQVSARAWRSDHIAVNGTPTNQQLVAEIPPGGSATVPQPFLWTPPFPAWAPQQGHFCLFAQVDSAGDPVTFPRGGWEAVKRDNNLALRGIQVAELRDGVPLTLWFLVAGDSDRLWLADLVLDARTLPGGLKTELTLPESILRYAKFEGIKIVRRHHEETLGEDRWDDSEDRRRSPHRRESEMIEEFESLNVTMEFEPGRVARIIDMDLRPRSQHLAKLVIQPGPGNPGRQQIALDIQQVVNRQIVGGLLYLLTPLGA